MLWISVLTGILIGIVVGSVYSFSRKLFLVGVIGASGVFALLLSVAPYPFLLTLQEEIVSWNSLLKLTGFLFGLYPGNDLGRILREEVK